MSEHKKTVGAWLTAARRRYIYRIANAGIALAVAYQLVDGDASALWLLLVNAVLGLADANTPAGEDEPVQP